MTVKEAIDAIDLLKPNQFDEQMKTAWISQAEALVQNEVLSYHKLSLIHIYKVFAQRAVKLLEEQDAKKEM